MPFFIPTYLSRLLTLSILFISFLSCTNKPAQYQYSIEDARKHMQQNNWDSARIYAVHVLAESQEDSAIALAQFIIDIAKENVRTDHQEKLEKKAEAYERLRKIYDLQEGISWYYSPLTTQFTNKQSFHLYLGESRNEQWIRFRIQYVGRRPLDLLGYTIQCEDREYTFGPESDIVYGKEEGTYWEYFDQKYNENTHSMISDIIQSGHARLILIGSGGNYERNISSDEIQAMQDVLQAFTFSPSSKDLFEFGALEN